MSVTDAGPIFAKTKVRAKTVTLTGQDQQIAPQEPTRIALIMSPSNSTSTPVYPMPNTDRTNGLLGGASGTPIKILMIETAGLCCVEWRVPSGGFGSFFVIEVLYNQEGDEQ